MVYSREQGIKKAVPLDLLNSLCPVPCLLPHPSQGPWARCYDPCGWATTPGERRAGALPNAPHRQSDRLRHGVPGLPALRTPGPGHQELPGWSQSAGEDRGLRHVQRCLQHRLLQGKVAFPAAGLSIRANTLLTCLCHCPLTLSLWRTHVCTCAQTYTCWLSFGHSPVYYSLASSCLPSSWTFNLTVFLHCNDICIVFLHTSIFILHAKTHTCMCMPKSTHSQAQLGATFQHLPTQSLIQPYPRHILFSAIIW